MTPSLNLCRGFEAIGHAVRLHHSMTPSSPPAAQPGTPPWPRQTASDPSQPGPGPNRSRHRAFGMILVCANAGASHKCTVRVAALRTSLLPTPLRRRRMHARGAVLLLGLRSRCSRRSPTPQSVAARSSPWTSQRLTFRSGLHRLPARRLTELLPLPPSTRVPDPLRASSRAEIQAASGPVRQVFRARSGCPPLPVGGPSPCWLCSPQPC